MSLRATKISELSFGVIFELCKHLDQPSQRNWKALLAKAPGIVYTPLDVGAFERIGNQPNGSSTQAVINDFMTRGYTVDDLFLMLNAIEHVEGMRVIRNHVSPKVKEVLDCNNVNMCTGQKEDSTASARFELHPEYGPLPPSHPHIFTITVRPTWGAAGNPEPSHVMIGGSAGHSPLPEEVGQGHTLKYEDSYYRGNVDFDIRLVEKGATFNTTTAVSSAPYPTHIPASSRANVPPTCLSFVYPLDPGPSPPPSSSSSLSQPPLHYHHTWQPQPQPYPLTLQRPLYPPSHHAPHHAPCPTPYHHSTTSPGPHYGEPGRFPGLPPTEVSVMSPASYYDYHRMCAPSGAPPPLFGSSSFQAPPLQLPFQPTMQPQFQSCNPQFQSCSPQSHSCSPQSQSCSPTTSDPCSRSGSSGFKDLPSPVASIGDSPGGQTPLLPILDPASSTFSVLVFGYSELSESTGNFTECLVGQGSFGSVFMARVRGNGPYAIKKLHSESEMEGGFFFESIHHSSFIQEVKVLSKYHHRNILSLVAYSADGPRPCLVYEYMKNGSLADCLLGKKNIPLPWSVRVNIAVEIATALNFLHTINKPKSLVHGDVKSSNILLDDHCVPKLSDFGLARELQSKPTRTSSYSTQSSGVMGTLAYMAPEFLRSRKMTTKTDVYSFGVVLLELFTGQAADDPTLKQRTLTVRLEDLLGDTDANRERILLEADSKARWPDDIGVGLFDIATICLNQKAKERPDMDQTEDHARYVSLMPQCLNSAVLPGPTSMPQLPGTGKSAPFITTPGKSEGMEATSFVY
eukprot:Em0014g356a